MTSTFAFASAFICSALSRASERMARSSIWISSTSVFINKLSNLHVDNGWGRDGSQSYPNRPKNNFAKRFLLFCCTASGWNLDDQWNSTAQFELFHSGWDQFGDIL